MDDEFEFEQEDRVDGQFQILSGAENQEDDGGNGANPSDWRPLPQNTASLCDAVIEAFLQSLRKFSVIWDKGTRGHRDHHQVGNCWEALLQEMKTYFKPSKLLIADMSTVKSLKAKLQNLKKAEAYSEKRCQGKSGAGRDEIGKPYKWSAQMAFF